MVNLFLILLVAACTTLIAQVSAVDRYYQCLKCFEENPVIDHYWCDGSRSCQPADSWDCLEEERIYSYVDCVEVVNQEKCFNYTFTVDDFEMDEPHKLVNSLNPGEGCWLQINRTLDGSYGTVSVEYDDPDIVVFDD